MYACLCGCCGLNSGPHICLAHTLLRHLPVSREPSHFTSIHTRRGTLLCLQCLCPISKKEHREGVLKTSSIRVKQISKHNNTIIIAMIKVCVRYNSYFGGILVLGGLVSNGKKSSSSSFSSNPEKSSSESKSTVNLAFAVRNQRGYRH